MIEIYTDGSCCGNGNSTNIGGHAFIGLVDNKLNYMYQAQEENTTNNRQELKAIYEALSKLYYYICKEKEVIIYSDSKYAIQCITMWYISWKEKNWLNSKGVKPANLDIISDIVAIIDTIDDNYDVDLHFEFVKGHNKNKYNEYADQLATYSMTIEELAEKEDKEVEV